MKKVNRTKRSQSQTFNKLKFYYQSSFLGRCTGILNRYIKSRNLNKKNRKSSISFRFLFRYKSFLFLFLSFLFLIFAIYNLTTYWSINPKAYEFAEKEEFEELDGEEYHVLFLGFSNYHSENKFLESIVLFAVNSKTSAAKAYAVNPEYVVNVTTINQDFTLRTVINNLSTENKIAQIKEYIGNLLGIRIDRNVIYDFSDLNSLIIEWNISSPVINSELETVDSKKGRELVNHLTSINNSDQKTLQYLELLIDNLESRKGFFSYYKFFRNHQKLENIFRTNMSRDELLDFSKAVYSMETPVKKDYLSTQMGFEVNTGIEDGYNPDLIILNDSIFNIFADVQILTEQAEIEVYNATTQAGLATKKRRLYQNQGANIVKFGNFSELTNKTTIYVLNTKISSVEHTLDMILRDVGYDVEILTEGYENNYTGQIIVVLGEDLVE